MTATKRTSSATKKPGGTAASASKAASAATTARSGAGTAATATARRPVGRATKAASKAVTPKSASPKTKVAALKPVKDPEAPPKDMSRWLGDGGMAVLEAVGVNFDDYGIEDDDRAGWATAVWEPKPLACNPHGTVQAGVHSVVLDAAMNFAVNAGLRGRDRTKATIELKTETMRPAAVGDRLSVRGAVVRETRQIAFAEARVEDAEARLVSRATGTFLLHRAE